MADMAAAWTACTKTQIAEEGRPPERLAAAGVFLLSCASRHKISYVFHRKIQRKWQIFDLEKTTIQEPRMITTFTTKSPQKTIHFHPLFPKTP
jgi:hypothetical protein